ncbi:hypothetical protein AsAng_0058790 [Aureispira anguillae]|uniref:Uncharacterized protein n=1 Tax=Aureispira anguillae TaxID=2864201 RepID=A0A915YKV7_9BACT|nr:hypothetical protein AsAng_0058790 [Aureispira anguillae]
MKAIFNILLLLLITAQTTKVVVVYVAFKWNQNFIAETLCENKTRPQLKCDGKCYLKKQISKQQKEEKSPLHSKKGQSFDYFVLQEKVWFSALNCQPIKIVNSAKKVCYSYLDLLSRLLVVKLLRPPSSIGFNL